jgi:hypothetical protein
MNKIEYRGTYQECFEHFINNLDLTSNLAELFRRITGATNEQISTWVNGEVSGPVSFKKVNTIFFMEELGYKIEERKNQHPDLIQLTIMIALKVWDTKSIQEFFGLNRESRIVRYLTTSQRLSDDRMEDLSQRFYRNTGPGTLIYMCDDLRSEFESELADALSDHADFSDEVSRDPSGLQVAPMVKTKNDSGHTKDHKEVIITALVSQVSAVVEMAEYLASGSCSASDREKLREKLPRGTINRLTKALTKLSGERARNQALDDEKNPL